MTELNRKTDINSLEAKPIREKIIQKDEITNLSITLNTSRDVKDFLRTLENNNKN